MEVRLLGPVEVHADGGQLPVRGPIQRALVGMLALHANRVVASQELLADQGHRPPAASTAKEASG
jgi:DNA-binding SARP family transcriptional activator